MNYKEWEGSVPDTIRGDMLWRMQAYRMAVFASDIGWQDVCKLAGDRRMYGVSDQLWRALGSIGANIAEGYSRGSAKDRARFFEYALGSARESRHWYYEARHIFAADVIAHRLDLTARLTKMLLVIVPAERKTGVGIKEDSPEYDAIDAVGLLEVGEYPLDTQALIEALAGIDPDAPVPGYNS
jgi:four helix bundle protein